MRTSGKIRKIIAQSMTPERYFNHIAHCIGRELDKRVLVTIGRESCSIILGGCVVKIPIAKIAELKKNGPYKLDSYIFGELKKKGFRFDKGISRYVRRCCRIFYRREDGGAY